MKWRLIPHFLTQLQRGTQFTCVQASSCYDNDTLFHLHDAEGFEYTKEVSRNPHRNMCSAVSGSHKEFSIVALDVNIEFQGFIVSQNDKAKPKCTSKAAQYSFEAFLVRPKCVKQRPRWHGRGKSRSIADLTRCLRILKFKSLDSEL